MTPDLHVGTPVLLANHRLCCALVEHFHTQIMNVSATVHVYELQTKCILPQAYMHFQTHIQPICELTPRMYFINAALGERYGSVLKTFQTIEFK